MREDGRKGASAALVLIERGECESPLDAPGGGIWLRFPAPGVPQQR